MKQFSRILLALMLTMALALPSVLPAAALKPSYAMEAPYLSSPFYEALVAYSLKDDMRYNVLSVAFTQIGYHEGDSEADMDGLNLFGKKNFVEYNRIYGKLDNGEGNGRSYGYAWCAAFVSWCLRQAGVPTSIAVTEVSCNRMTEWYRTNSTFHPRKDGYQPLPGDIIMFHKGDGKASHVGLVVGVKEGDVYTVEGNNGGVVGQHMYKTDDSAILGYCVPAYTQDPATVYDFPIDAEASSPGEYVVTADSLNVRAGAGASHDKLGVLKQGETVKVTMSDGSWGRIDYAGKEGWVSMSYLASSKHLAYTVRYSVGDGKNAPISQRKKPGENLTISDTLPEQRGYTFAGWAIKQPATEVVYRAGDKYTADENLTLYAVWTPEIYKLTLKLDDGAVWQTLDIPFGEKVNLADVIPQKLSDGENRYTFAGWSEKVPQYLREDGELTATFTATPLTAEEKAALTAAETTPTEVSVSTAAVITMAVSIAVILAAGAILVVAGARVRRRKLSELDAAMAEAPATDEETESAPDPVETKENT